MALGAWAWGDGRRAGGPRAGLLFLSVSVCLVPVGSEVREPDGSPQGETPCAPPTPTPGHSRKGKGHHLQGRVWLGQKEESWGSNPERGHPQRPGSGSAGLTGRPARLCPGPTLSAKAWQAAPARPPCHAGIAPAGRREWLRFQEAEYKFFEHHSTWTQAQRICTWFRAELASVHSQAELDFLGHNLQKVGLPGSRGRSRHTAGRGRAGPRSSNVPTRLP